MNETSTSHSASRTIASSAMTALAFIVISLLVNAVIRIDYVFLNNRLGEISVTEMAEQLALFMSSLLFFLLAKSRSDLKHAAVLIGSFFLVMLIRELDFWFDLLVHGFWVYPALLVTFSALVYAGRAYPKSKEEMAEILRAQHMLVVIIGVIFLLVYSRLFGTGSLWRSIMTTHYMPEVKNIAEEGTELLAYLIIAYGSIRVYFERKHR